MTSPLPSPPPDQQPANNSPTHDEHQAPTTAEEAEEQPPEKELEDNPPPQSEPSQTITLSVSESQDNDPNQSDMEASHPTTFSATSAFTRRGGGSLKRNKSKRFAAAKLKKLNKKLEALNENLNPIPFKPAKDLDFASHEELLKRLGLWEFVNIKFDGSLRGDLVAQLIASYDPQQRAGYVNEARVRLNRADLGRALKLPAKKDKVSAPEAKASEEEIAFIAELVSTWMLLHDDTWMMPSDIYNWTKTIKEGSFERVDWAGLIWSMVEKELSAAPNLGNCYYASHLQCLIKCQKENMLKEEESHMQMEEDTVEEVVKTNEEFDVVTGLKEDSIELRLGTLDNDDVSEKGKEDVVAEQAMVVEKDKEVVEEQEQEQREWFKSSMDDETFLQHCSVAKSDEEEMKQDVAMNEVEDVEEMDFNRSPKEDDALEGVDSENFLASMDVGQGGIISSEMELHANLAPGDFLASTVDIATNYGNGNDHKRDISQLDDDEDDDIPHHAFDKRIRSDEQQPPYDVGKVHSETDVDYEQMQYLMNKTRASHMEKERALQEASLNYQQLLNEVQARDDMIQHLQSIRYEEQQKRHLEICKLERELDMMGNLLTGYRKALKETQKSFAEYRKKCPFPEEPLYKDFGEGGLVLTTAEVDKLRRDEEERLNLLSIEKQVKEFEEEWVGKFQAHQERIDLLGGKLLDTETNVNLLKEMQVKRSTSTPIAECTPTETQ
ncbi:hypothetical protein LINGRAHAP2_LOCUS28043 [Linum grandiflorum]